MKFVYPTVSILAYYSTFGIASPENELLTSGMGGYIDPNTPPRTALFLEKNGRAPTGVPIFSTQDDSSCWTVPNDPAFPGTKPIKNGGTCRVCVIQNATGQEPDRVPSYEMWVRDDKDHAIGDMQPFTMAPSQEPPYDPTHQPSAAVSFPVGAADLNVWSTLPDVGGKYVAVYMVWNQLAGWAGPETMLFNTGSEQKVANNNCTLAHMAQDESGMLYFSCQFNCGTIHPKHHRL